MNKNKNNDAPTTSPAVVVDHNSTETPITRQKIRQLDAEQWPNMSLNELYDQRVILANRIHMASLYGNNPGVVLQLQQGLASLDGVIMQKSYEQNEVTLI